MSSSGQTSRKKTPVVTWKLQCTAQGRGQVRAGKLFSPGGENPFVLDILMTIVIIDFLSWYVHSDARRMSQINKKFC